MVMDSHRGRVCGRAVRMRRARMPHSLHHQVAGHPHHHQEGGARAPEAIKRVTAGQAVRIPRARTLADHPRQAIVAASHSHHHQGAEFECQQQQRRSQQSRDSLPAPAPHTGSSGAWSTEEATPPSTPPQPPQRRRTSDSRPPRSSRSIQGQHDTRRSSDATNAPSKGGVPGQAHERKRVRSPSNARDSSQQPSSKRHRQDAGSKPGRQSAPQKDWGSLLLDAHTATTPAACFQAVYQLGKRVQHDQQTPGQKHSTQLHEMEAAADALAAKLLGSSTGAAGSSRSSTRAAPFQQLNSMQLSLTVWGFAIVLSSSSNPRSRQVGQLIDGAASFAVQSSVMDRAGVDGCMHWSRLLHSTAKLGIKCQDSQPVQQLFSVAAHEIPDMLRQKLPCEPQSISNALWAFATAEYPGSLHGLVAEVASSNAQAMAGAISQQWSDTLWALGKMAERRVDLGEHSSVDAIMGVGAASMAEQRRSDVQNYSKSLWGLAKAGCRPHDSITRKLAAAVAERSSDAKPQKISNTLWALATLDSNPDASTVSKLAAALAERNDADPQALSNTLWALSRLSWYDARQIPVMVAALVQHKSNPADPAQHFSNALQALGTLRWYDASRYSQLVEGVLLKISSDAPDEAGQQLSNTMFSCALSCHFDSSVDELAEWGSQQSLQHWDEQEVSNAVYAWAILSATAGGDTASMRKLAHHLFAEASKRGVAAFQARSDWYRHMGKLFGAHQEALRVCLLGGGVSDAELLQAASGERARLRDVTIKQQCHVTSAVSTSLQGVYDVQAATVQGYHALLVHHPSCPRGIALEVTHPYKAYLRHPSGQLYGKAALRVEQMKRACGGAAVCDGAELGGMNAEQLRAMLVKRIEQAAQG